jgi:cytochrome c556
MAVKVGRPPENSGPVSRGKATKTLFMGRIFFYRLRWLGLQNLPETAPHGSHSPPRSTSEATSWFGGTHRNYRFRVAAVLLLKGFCKMKRSRIAGTAALALLAFAVSGLAFSHADETLTNKQIMAKINGPKGVFNAVKKGLNSSSPDWAALTKETKQMCELSEAMAKNSPRKGSPASWEKFTATYVKNVKALADASEKMDLKAAKDAQRAIGGSCSACHRAHK